MSQTVEIIGLIGCSIIFLLCMFGLAILAGWPGRKHREKVRRAWKESARKANEP